MEIDYEGKPPYEYDLKRDWLDERKLRRQERRAAVKQVVKKRRLEYLGGAIACLCFAVLFFSQNCFLDVHDYNMKLLYSVFAALVIGLLCVMGIFIGLAINVGDNEE